MAIFRQLIAFARSHQTPRAAKSSSIPIVPLLITGDRVHLESRASARANQPGRGLNQFRRIETDVIFEDQVNILDVFNLLRRVASHTTKSAALPDAIDPMLASRPM